MAASEQRSTDQARADVDTVGFPLNGHDLGGLAAPTLEEPGMPFDANSVVIDSTTTQLVASPRVSERKLVRWVAAYVAAGAMLLQVMEALSQAWGLTIVVQQCVSLALLLGLPHAIVVAWYHGERGRQRVCMREVACIAIFTLVAFIVLRVTLR